MMIMTISNTFFLFSWTQDEYLEAIKDEAFYKAVEAKFDAPSVSEVEDEEDDEAKFDGLSVSEVQNEANEEEELRRIDKKRHRCALKFYYAGGSCQFMFQYPTKQVKDILNTGVQSALNTAELVNYCGGIFHTDAINQLFGMQYDGTNSGRYPVNSYAASLFAEGCGADVIADLVRLLNASNNPSVAGHLFEWLFFAAVQQRKVKLFSDQGVEEMLPKANVLRFDPKKQFKKSNGNIIANQLWLQPVAWNQGGYDAVHFDTKKKRVIFVQLTQSDKHDFKRDYFHEVLLKLGQARMRISKVVVCFVVKPAQYLKFRFDHVDGRDLLEEFDKWWTRSEENSVRCLVLLLLSPLPLTLQPRDFSVPPVDFTQPSSSPNNVHNFELLSLTRQWHRRIEKRTELRCAKSNLRTAATCAVSKKKAEFLLHRQLRDGTNRYTVSLESGRQLAETLDQSAELMAICPEYVEIHAASVLLWNWQWQNVGTALDATPKLWLSKGVAMTARKLLEESVHLDNFHAYEAAQDLRRLEEDVEIIVADMSLEL